LARWRTRSRELHPTCGNVVQVERAQGVANRLRDEQSPNRVEERDLITVADGVVLRPGISRRLLDRPVCRIEIGEIVLRMKSGMDEVIALGYRVEDGAGDRELV